MQNSENINPPENSILTVRNGCMFVDGKPFVVIFPDERIECIEGNKLVTAFREYLFNYWSHSEIEGYWA